MAFIESSKSAMRSHIHVMNLLVLSMLERETDLLIKSPQVRYEKVLKRSPQLFQEIPLTYIASYLRMTPEFKAGWFGNYSALNMLPKKKGKVNMPMKTFKNMNPHGQSVKLQVLDTFISQMKELMSLLEASKEVDLRKTKCTLTLRWMKFTLGDTLHFMINHNIRHMIQIKKIFAPISA